MNNILKSLYYGQINEAMQNIDVINREKELEIYDLLCSSLNNEQLQLLDTWYKQIAARFTSRIEFTFEHAFKLGFHFYDAIKDFEI